jgi:predicted acyl esterase
VTPKREQARHAHSEARSRLSVFFTAYRRLRLVLRSPNSIQFEKNYNSGSEVTRKTTKGARTAHITLYHDAAHPSQLELSVVK